MPIKLSRTVFSKYRAFRMALQNKVTDRVQLIDIGSNLTDEMYSGVYNDSKKHEPDLDKVLERSWAAGVEKIIVTAGNLEEAKKALHLAETNDRLYSTVGVHPTRCHEFDEDPQGYVSQLRNLIIEGGKKIVAVGEFGLDYDRIKFCDVETQKRNFELQLQELAQHVNRPLFLHCRAAASDLAKILSENKHCTSRGGVIHSFDGTIEEAQTFIDLGFSIGLNGCSLKTEENLKVVKEIPVDKILLETDSPWCGIRPSHAGSKFIKTKFESAKKNWSENTMYKSRNEPQTMINVLEIVAGVKDMDTASLAAACYENTLKLFF